MVPWLPTIINSQYRVAIELYFVGLYYIILRYILYYENYGRLPPVIYFTFVMLIGYYELLIFGTALQF